MTARSVQFRALLLPLCVSIASMAALAWYGVVWIPSQQRYLNQRNFRLLRTVSALIKTKVDNFDAALDHALESDPGGKDRVNSLKNYVRLVAPDLQVLTIAENPSARQASTAAQSVLTGADDPPRVQLQRDEGRYYLYLGLKHGEANPIVVARADLEQATAPYLTPGSALDALLLVSRDGRVIAQRSPLGLDLARVDRLASAAADGQAADPSKESARTNIFELLWMTGNTKNVKIGDVDYKLYVQPLPLSLLQVGGKTDEVEEWAVCGLVRADKFAAESAAISYSYLLLFTGTLAGILFTIPLLKLHLLSPHERLRRSDGVWVTAAAFSVTGILTFGLLDTYYFGYDFRHVTDAQLKAVASTLRESFWTEAADVERQMKSFEKLPLWEDVPDHGDRQYSFNHGKIPATITVGGKDNDLVCRPGPACRTRIVALPQSGQETIYPYFDLVTWNDDAGWQRIKWSATGSVTPFLNIKDEKVAYYQDLDRAWRFNGMPRTGISAIPSPTTGQPVTVFWRARDLNVEGPALLRPMQGGSATGLIGQSLALFQPPLSLDQPVLPPHVQFAVTNKLGLVIFHSDSTRSLKENFLQECEDDAALRAALAAHRDQALSVNYLGRPHRLHVTPLTMAAAAGSLPFADPEWSLAVFQDTIVPQTLNLESLTLAVALFAIFGAFLAGAWCLQRALMREAAVKWFWPDDRKGARYRLVARMNGVLSALSLVAVARLTSSSLLVATGLVAIIALVATCIVVVRAGRPAAEAGAWQQPFLRARLSLLFVVSVVPAIACFHVAYDFETGLFIRSGQLSLARASDDRQDRIRRRRELLFQKAGDPKAGAPERSFGVSLAPFFEADQERFDETQFEPLIASRLDTWLSLLHRLYNDVAVDPASVFPDGGDANAAVARKWTASGRHWWEHGLTRFSLSGTSSGDERVTTTAKTADLNGWYVPIVAVLVGALFVLLRFVVRPLYAMDLYPSPGIVPTGTVREPPVNLLLIGPPGSGKTDRLRRDPTSLIFDVRTLTFVDRPRHARPVAVGRRKISGAPIPFYDAAGIEESEAIGTRRQTTTTSETWPESLDASNLPGGRDTVVGIDHLDHRLSDPAFRDRFLTFVEDLIFRHERTVWVAAAREPLGQLQEACESRPAPDASEMNARKGAPIDLNRWARVFQSFRRETAGVAPQPTPESLTKALAASGLDKASLVYALVIRECSLAPQLLAIGRDFVSRRAKGALTREDVWREIGAAADPYYRSVWSSCSPDEKLALRQLADEGIVNPRNAIILEQLLQKGLVCRDPTLCIMNETFRRFIVRETPAEQIDAWEHHGVRMPWGTIRTTLATVALGLLGLLVLTQQQLLNAWVGYVPALAPAVPTVLKLLASVQHGPKAAILNT